MPPLSIPPITGRTPAGTEAQHGNAVTIEPADDVTGRRYGNRGPRTTPADAPEARRLQAKILSGRAHGACGGVKNPLWGERKAL